MLTEFANVPAVPLHHVSTSRPLQICSPSGEEPNKTMGKFFSSSYLVRKLHARIYARVNAIRKFVKLLVHTSLNIAPASFLEF